MPTEFYTSWKGNVYNQTWFSFPETVQWSTQTSKYLSQTSYMTSTAVVGWVEIREFPRRSSFSVDVSVFLSTSVFHKERKEGQVLSAVLIWGHTCCKWVRQHQNPKNNNDSALLTARIFSLKQNTRKVQAVDAAPLKALKDKMKPALSSLIWWKVSLPMSEGLELESLSSL